MNAAEIIDKLGGQARVAELCEVTVQAVHQWKKKNHVPKAQLKFLQAVRPDVFEDPRPSPATPNPQQQDRGANPKSRDDIAADASSVASTNAVTPSGATGSPSEVAA